MSDAARAAYVGTRIVATLGPATSGLDRIAALLDAGASVFRINFSHGRREEHAALVRNVRLAAADRREGVAIMGDLCGPKVRLGPIAEGGLQIAPGESLCLTGATSPGDENCVSLNLPEIIDDVQIGDRVLIDDGALRFRVTAKSRGRLSCACEVGGTLRAHKGVNLPDSDLNLDPLTTKDRDDLRFAIESQLDYVAISFVRKPDDVLQLRALLDQSSASLHIVSKIETPQAVRNLDAIIVASDAVIVARGDLGVEMDVAHVPRVQKTIVARCRRAGKPVIVATQMLQSMIESPMPTRAEVSDVANAIVDGADAVMLSGETAVGKYPIEAVAMMRRIAQDTEAYDQDQTPACAVNAASPGVSAAVAASIRGMVEQLAPRAVVVWTEAGTLARLVSRHRLDRPVIALTPSEAVRRRMALYFGVFARVMTPPRDTATRFTAIDAALVPDGWAEPGSLVILGVGPESLARGNTGAIAIRIVGADAGV